MLDCMTWPEILMYYEKGIRSEEIRAQILINTLAKAINAEDEAQNKRVYKEWEDQTPDRAALYARYGKSIKRR